MNEDLTTNEVSDDELTNLFDDDGDTSQDAGSNQTQNIEEDDNISEDSDEDVQNLFKPKQKQKQSGDKSDSDVNETIKPQQKQQQNNSRSQDLVDSNGKLLARAGAERRFYEENQRLKQERNNFNNVVLPQIRQQYQKMETELEQYKGIVEGIRATDLTPQDIQSGLDFVRNWRKNPKDVVKFLLTSLQSSGIDIDIDGMHNDSQMAAIKQMIDEKFAPFDKEREEAERIAEQEAEVEQTYNSFITKYPDAVVHDKVLAHMIKYDPTLTPEMAYLQLQNYYLRNNLDFSKSLEAIAMENKNNTTKPNQGLPQTPTISDNVATKPQQQRVANVGTSMNDIIKQAMTDAGF